MSYNIITCTQPCLNTHDQPNLSNLITHESSWGRRLFNRCHIGSFLTLNVCFTHSFMHIIVQSVIWSTTVTPQLAECFSCCGYCLIWDIWVCCKWIHPVSPGPSSYSATPTTPAQASADHSTAGEFSARARFHLSVWIHQHLLQQTWVVFIFLSFSGRDERLSWFIVYIFCDVFGFPIEIFSYNI